MDLFGDKLKEIRLEKGFSLDQIARETKISRKYLEAIEENDFSVFPSETYLIGFLRNYTEYLGLDSTKYINQYRNYIIQEQPIPINELLDMKKRFNPALLVVLIFLGVAVVAVGSIFVYRVFFGDQTTQIAQEQSLPVSVQESDSGKEFYFKDEVSTNWFLTQDKIIIPLGETEYILSIKNIDKGVTFQLGEDVIELAPQEELVFNLNDDDSDDLKIILNKIEENEKGLQVNLGLYKVTATITSTMPVIAQKPAQVTAETVTTRVEPQSAETNVDLLRDTTVIFESEEADPFVITIQFEGQCLFRYLQDGKNRYQKFFQNNDALDIDVNSQVVLWISNAGSVNARISGKKIVFGKAGQVVTKMLQWRRDSAANKYKLELSSIY